MSEIRVQHIGRKDLLSLEGGIPFRSLSLCGYTFHSRLGWCLPVDPKVPRCDLLGNMLKASKAGDGIEHVPPGLHVWATLLGCSEQVSSRCVHLAHDGDLLQG